MADTLPSLASRLQAIVETLAPRSILRLGPRLEPAPSWRAIEVRLPPGEAVDHLAPGVRYDLALVDARAGLPPGDAAVVLARLRDLCARHVLVATDTTAADPWTRRALVAFGYVHLGDCTTADGPVSLFEFDISTYKTTPDWLSPRNWANPELWDRYRW